MIKTKAVKYPFDGFVFFNKFQILRKITYKNLNIESQLVKKSKKKAVLKASFKKHFRTMSNIRDGTLEEILS